MFENFAAKLKKMREAKGEEENLTFKPFPEETVSVKVEEKVEEPKKLPAPAEVKADDSDTNIELKVVRPTSFEEVSTVADYLLAGCTVVLNLELLDMPQVMRMLDFLNGVTYSTDGDIKNVSKSTYIITSRNVDISGDE
jgi:cell division inhibitor SepF